MLLRTCLVRILLCTMLAPALAAQAGAPLAGDRVRVFASSGSWEGSFVALDTATLRFVPRGGGSEVIVPRRSVARIEVQRGRRPAPGKGARIGLAAGAVAGAVLAVATYEECEPGVDPACLGPGVAVLGGIGIGGLAGAGVGAIIGAVTQEDAWVPVDLRSLRVGAIPVRDGLGITLSTSF